MRFTKSGFALQLFSRSVACGLKLYKNHVDGLSDCDPTIEFTKKMNHIFDLMNSRHPVDAIRLNDKRDQIKVTFIAWSSELN
jgi:hypothetical protein